MEIAKYEFGQEATVALWGPNRPNNVKELAVRYGAKPGRIYLVKAASTRHDSGFLEIRTPRYGDAKQTRADMATDGIILTDSQSAAIFTPADCPIVTLYDVVTGNAVVFHAGRAALTPVNKPGEPIRNIVTKAFLALTNGRSGHYIAAHISATICPHCFKHETNEARGLIKPFEQFGEVAFLDRDLGQLDMSAIIRHQLRTLGISNRNIHSDNLCTYENPQLASYRRDHSSTRNAVIVVLR